MKLIKVTLLFFLILLGFSSFAFSDTYPYVSVWYYNAIGVRGDTQQSACDAAIASYSGSSCTVSFDGYQYWGRIYGTDGFLITSSFMSPDQSCPSGGSQTVGNGACNNAPACTAPAVRATASPYGCETPKVACPAGTYDNAGTCTPIPDCNAANSWPSSFFDIVSKSCVTDPKNTTCLDPATNYCPPVDNCIARGVICSDNQAAVDTANATRQASIDAAKTAADSNQKELDALKHQSEAASAAKTAEAQASEQAKAAAQSAAESAAASGDKAAADASRQRLADAVQKYLDSKAKSTNSRAASDAISELDQQAQAAGSKISSSNPGDASTLSKQVGSSVQDALKKFNDAVTGNGNGNGAGSGVSNSDSPSTDTSGLAKESTQEGIAGTLKDLVKGNGKGITPKTGNDHFDDSQPTNAVEEAKTAYREQFDIVRSSLRNMFTPVSGAGASLPTFDYGMIHGVHVLVDLNRYASQLSYIGLAILFLAAFISVRLFLD
jgi:hypothetical protein